MHPCVYQEFERICATRDLRGSVLEVGAAPSDDCLLNMKALSQVSEKIGVDLGGPYEFNDFKVLKANGNAMDCFEANRFDTVLCNSVLEHDKYFWKTISEIKRVTKPGGLILIGVPGYEWVKGERLKSAMSKTPLLRGLRSHRYLSMFFYSTITLHVHNHPGDYYRFSPQCMREVFLEGLESIEVKTVMLPPRVIGLGIKPR